MKKFSRYLPLLILAIVVISNSAFATATADADVVALTGDAEATFGVVKTAAIGFLVFAIGLRFARKWLK